MAPLSRHLRSTVFSPEICCTSKTWDSKCSPVPRENHENLTGDEFFTVFRFFKDHDPLNERKAYTPPERPEPSGRGSLSIGTQQHHFISPTAIWSPTYNLLVLQDHRSGSPKEVSTLCKKNKCAYSFRDF